METATVKKASYGGKPEKTSAEWGEKVRAIERELAALEGDLAEAEAQHRRVALAAVIEDRQGSSETDQARQRRNTILERRADLQAALVEAEKARNAAARFEVTVDRNRQREEIEAACLERAERSAEVDAAMTRLMESLARWRTAGDHVRDLIAHSPWRSDAMPTADPELFGSIFEANDFRLARELGLRDFGEMALSHQRKKLLVDLDPVPRLVERVRVPTRDEAA